MKAGANMNKCETNEQFLDYVRNLGLSVLLSVVVI